MKKFLPFFLLLLIIAACTNAQVVRPFGVRYYNPSVRGNIVYISNSSISTSGVGTGNPGTGEVAPAGTSKDNNGAGINIDVDNSPSVTKLPFNSTWNYHSNGAAPANDISARTWINSAYIMPAAWNTGASGTNTGPYGFNSTQNTCVPNGSTLCTPGGGANKYSSYYFRNSTLSFTATELSTTFTSIQLNLKRNDGVVIYINGVERARDNMPAGTPVYGTFASAAIATGVTENYTVNLSPAFFVTGANTIAVEIHTDKLKAADMNFDMEVLGVPLDNSGTFNSSTSDLALATSCNKVLFAGLYWGADQGTDGVNTSWITANHNKVKLKLPGGAYQIVNSQQSDYHSAALSAGLPHTGYLCFADITSILNTTSPNGTYSVADMIGPVGITNACGGWTIVIAYSSPTLTPKNLTVFDGSVIINGGDPPVDIAINGFLTPPTGPVSCELGAVVYDGDRGSTDAFGFEQNGTASFYDLATTAVPFNGTADAWNSKISYKSSIVTSRNPAFQNTLGYDASIFDLPNTSNAQLSNSQTGATVRFSSPSENYFVHVVTTAISQFNPSFNLTKTSADINGGTLIAGDSLRYLINYQNVGNDVSLNSIITDNIPLGASYLPGSLKINGVTKTDPSADDQAEYSLTNNKVTFRIGTGATAAAGGSLTVSGSGNVQFDVVLASSCVILGCTSDSIHNSARIDYTGQTSGSSLHDTSGINVSGCVSIQPVVNFVYGPCFNPQDTLIVNSCPVTSITIPWRKYAGYTIYSALPFIPANIYNPLTPVTSSHVYWAYYTNGSGCSHTIKINIIITPCPDIDDDDDGIPDYVEFNNTLSLADHNGNGKPNWNDPLYPGWVDNNTDNVNDNFDWGADSDNDGLPNFYDHDFWVSWVDVNGDGVNDAADMDLDGIPNQYDRDSDNDGIPDVMESYGVDTNGDGKIDNYVDSDNDGFSQNVDANTTGVTGSGVGLGPQDLDADGIPNYLDSDSDNDGIPDVIEGLGTDANNNGKIDNYIDTDGDGLSDAVDGDVGNDNVSENSINALLPTGPDTTPVDGRADSYPYKNMDNDKRANPYDLDSDGDGIADVIEAGFTDANYNGFVDGGTSSNGWNSAIQLQASLGLLNTDGRGSPDYLDIDADDDGIPDNIEGQTTAGYKFPVYTDTDSDGIDNNYDAVVGFGGSGIFIADFDGDGIPDYRDTDTDADGIIDIVEGNDFNLNGVWDDNVTLTLLDSDGDGLDNKFDSLNSVTNIKGTSYRMGTSGSLTGDPTPGSRTPVQKTVPSQTNRDWRYVGVVLPVQVLQFNAVPQLQTVFLSWSIISPQYLDHFEIERSTDNYTFIKVGDLAATNVINQMQNYNTVDEIKNVKSEIIYYRLRIIARNEQENYSNVLLVRTSLNKLSLIISPNPANNFTSVNFVSDKKTLGTFRVLDNTAKEMLVIKQIINKGNNSIQLTNLSKLSNGVYTLQAFIGEEVITRKLVIQNR
ncbi:MAG: T9SS type A sorting domain-containing protein [Ferruginibacter sp.]